MKFLGLLLVVVAVLHSASATSWWRRYFMLEQPQVTTPKFCKDSECPKFTVLKAYDDYELREYEPSAWVYTHVDTMTEDYWEDRGSTKKAFWKLFEYIQGANEQNMTVNMTVPVVNSHAQDEVVMHFMIPSSLAKNPPKPSDSDVKLYQASKDQYYVRSFGGWGWGWGTFFGHNNFKDEFNNLVKKLDEDKQEYTIDPMFFTAVYNDPWDIFGRHNEVWIMKK